MPWKLAKEESLKPRLAQVLYNLTEGICIGASLLAPFMPETSEKILSQMNSKARTIDELHEFGKFVSGTKVAENPEALFIRLDPKKILEQVKEKNEEKIKEKIEEKKETEINLERKPEITYEDFSKLQFQVGEIIACEEVKKSKKLLCSKVKIGSEIKQIVSGIKAWYKPEDMVGKKVMVLVNLKPATLAGIVSEGMLLCAEDENGKLALMTPENDMPSGAEIC